MTLPGSCEEQEGLAEQRVSRKLGVRPWAPQWGDRAQGVSVLGRPRHPDWLGRMLSPGSPTPPVCTPHPRSCLPWRSPHPSASLGDGVGARRGPGSWLALGRSLPWQVGARPWAAAQRAAKLAASSRHLRPMFGSHLPAQTARVSMAPTPPAPHRRAGPMPLVPGSLSHSWHGLRRGWGMLSPCWAGARGGVWASAWKMLCWPGPHAGAGGGFERAVEHLGTCPGKDLAAGGAGCRLRCRGSCAAQGCRSLGTGCGTGMGCMVSPPRHGPWGRGGVHSAITEGYVCVCAPRGVCDCVCARLGTCYTSPPTPFHGCERGGVCLGVCACGYPGGVCLWVPRGRAAGGVCV